MKKLPKFHETFLPILHVLADSGPLATGDLRRAVRDRFYADLPSEILQQKTKSGDQLVLNRVGWGKAYLKQAKMLASPERGIVAITDKGRAVLDSGTLTLAQLKSDPDFQAHEIAKGKAVHETEDGDHANSEESTPTDLIESGIANLERETKAELLQRLKQVDPYDFERIVLQLFQKMGYGEFLGTPKSGDGGIDGVINQDQLGLEKIYVQAKRYSENKVREPDIRNFIGAMAGDTQKGIFVTTADFDDKAIQKAREAHHTIILISGIQLADLMYRFGIGVQIQSTYEIKQLDEDFFVEG